MATCTHMCPIHPPSSRPLQPAKVTTTTSSSVPARVHRCNRRGPRGWLVNRSLLAALSTFVFWRPHLRRPFILHELGLHTLSSPHSILSLLSLFWLRRSPSADQGRTYTPSVVYRGTCGLHTLLLWLDAAVSAMPSRRLWAHTRLTHRVLGSLDLRYRDADIIRGHPWLIQPKLLGFWLISTRGNLASFFSPSLGVILLACAAFSSLLADSFPTACLAACRPTDRHPPPTPTVLLSRFSRVHMQPKGH